MISHPSFPLKPSKEMAENMEKIKKTNPPNFHLHSRMMKLLGTFDPISLDVPLPAPIIPKTFEFIRSPSTIEEIAGGELRSDSRSCLSREQLNNLWRRGFFETKGLSEVRRFRCSKVVFPGLRKINKEYCNNLAYIIDICYMLKSFLYNESGRVSINNGIVHIASIFKSLAHIFIGYPLKEENTNAFEIKYQLQRERMKALLQDPLVDQELLRQGISGKTHLLYELQKEFERDWQNIETKEIESLNKYIEEKGEIMAEEIKKQLTLKKQNLFAEFLEKKIETTEGDTRSLLVSFLNYYSALVIIKKEVYEHKLEKRRKLIEIYGSGAFRRRVYRRIKRTEIEENTESSETPGEEIVVPDRELLYRITLRLDSLPQQKYLFQNYIQFLTSYKAFVKKNIKKIEKPYKVYLLKYKFYPPGDIVRTLDYKTNKIKYSLEKENIIQVSSVNWGWRLEYYVHKLFSNCNNIGLKITSLAIYGRLGIKRLFGINVFYPNDCIYVNEHDGEYQYISGTEVTTILSLFQSMCKHIASSRSRFLESDEAGNCLLNFLNVFWLYVLRIIFQGIIFYGIIMPILILVHFLLCLVFLFLSLVMGFLYTLAYVIINILVFDYVVQPIEDLIEFSIKFPLIFEIANTVINGMLQILLSLLFLLLSPIFVVLIIFFSSLIYVLRLAVSIIVFPLISCFTRQPNTSKNNYCFKEIGRGSSQLGLRFLFWDDLLYIILAFLEKAERENASKSIKGAIDDTDSKIRDILNSNGLSRVEKKLYNEQSEIIFQTCRQLKTSLSIKQQEMLSPLLLSDLSIYRLFYKSPEDLNIRLKKLSRCVEIFLARKKLDFIWKFYPDLPNGDYELLTRKLIQSVFGIQIFETLSEDQKITFQDFHKDPDFSYKLDSLVDHKMGNDWLIDHFDKENLDKKAKIFAENINFEFTDIAEILQTSYEVIDKPIERSLLLGIVS